MQAILATPPSSRASSVPPVGKLSARLRALIDADVRSGSSVDRTALHAYFRRCEAETADDPLRASVWSLAMVAALLALNQSHACGELWRFLDAKCADDMPARVRLAQRLREVTYKATSLVALPMAINAATALKDAMDPDVLAALPDEPRLVSHETLTPVIERAKSFWARIYGTFAERAFKRIAAANPAVMAWITLCSYGVLSDTSILSAPETSVAIVSAIRAVGGLGLQVKGHVFALVTWPGWDDEQAIWLLGFVDQTRDFFAAAERKS